MSLRFSRPALVALLLAGFPLWVACGQEPGGASPAAKKSTPSWEVYFSPHGGCTEAVVKAREMGLI